MHIGYIIKKIIVVYLPIVVFYFFIVGWISVVFLNPKKDTTIFLSIGFAMLMSLSAVCFSWVKTIDDKDQKTTNIIKICGESFLLTAVIIVVAIALKFISITFIEQKEEIIIFMGKISYWLSYILTLTAITYFAVAYGKLLDLLFSRVDKDIQNL